MIVSCALAKSDYWASTPISTHLERDVLLVHPHFQLLSSDNVLLRPRHVVFSERGSVMDFARWYVTGGAKGQTHFVISLSRMILFNSSTTAGETNTKGQLV